MFTLTQPFYEDDTGANGGEAADLQTDNLDNKTDDTGTGASDNSGAADQNNVQSDDENAKYAAARREGETKAKAAEDKRVRDIDIAKKYSKDYDVFCEEDIAEKYGDNGIKTLEDLENAILQESYKNAGIDPELINQAINNHPVVKQAGQYVNTLQEEKRQQQIKTDIEALHKEFPETSTIKTEEDLYKLPEWGEVLSYIQKGYDMPDAYYKVNKNKVAGTIAKNAVQRTIADIQDRSKRGVVNGGDAGNEDIDLPTLTKEGNDMANAFGNDPKAIAKYVKTKLKNKE